MKEPLNPNWNYEVVKGLKKAEFLEMHKDAYPELDLVAEYDRVTKPVKEAAPVEK